MNKILKVIFILSAIVFCIAVTVDNDIIRTITKPIPLLSLLFLTKIKTRYNRFILIGFLFSLMGDVFLLKVLDLFILGLSSFLLAHFFYIMAFSVRKRKIELLSSIPFYIIAAGLAYYFYPHLGDMLIPVFLYIFIIITMVWRSYLQRKFNNFAMFAFYGAVLFAVSDTNIAYTKFVTNYEYSNIVTIIFYWTAQYLIYISTLKQVKK